MPHLHRCRGLTLTLMALALAVLPACRSEQAQGEYWDNYAYYAENGGYAYGPRGDLTWRDAGPGAEGDLLVGTQQPWLEGPRAISGRIYNLYTVADPGQIEPVLLGELQTDSGDTFLIDLGRPGDFQASGLSDGTMVQVVGMPTYLGGRKTLVAQQVVFHNRAHVIDRGFAPGYAPPPGAW